MMLVRGTSRDSSNGHPRTRDGLSLREASRPSPARNQDASALMASPIGPYVISVREAVAKGARGRRRIGLLIRRRTPARPYQTAPALAEWATRRAMTTATTEENRNG